MPDQDAINEQEWTRPENWGRFGTYRSTRDTRFLVPKRNPRMGWTFNLARRGAMWAMWGPALVPLGFLLVFVLKHWSH